MDQQALKKFVYRKYGLQFRDNVSGYEGHQVLMVGERTPFAVLSTSRSLLDVQCPRFAAMIQNLPYFQAPSLVVEENWVETDLQQISDHDLQNVLDYAFKSANSNGNENFVAQQLIYLPGEDETSDYQAQQIPPHHHKGRIPQRNVPSQLKKMMESYDYTILPADEQGMNFYRQGQMVADYEDHYDQIYELRRYYPDYHAMNVHQLRTYFTWRTQLRQGDFTVSSTSYAYVYIYELLNNIGVQNPATGFDKLLEFSQRYADNYGQRMQDYLHQWLQDYVLYYGLDRQRANIAFADKLAKDRDYHVLLHPADYSPEEITKVFINHCSYLAKCRLYKKAPAEWSKVVKVVWQHVLDKQPQAFSQMLATYTWSTKYFFADAVFSFRQPPRLREYPIDSERKYQFKDRKYYCQTWYPRKDQAKRLNTFFHELDRLARQEFHLGHPLQARPLDEEILAAILEGIHDYQRERTVAQEAQIKINMGYLGQIRADASVTRDNLLTDEEKKEDPSSPTTDELKTGKSINQQEEASNNNEKDEIGDDKPALTSDERFLIKALLQHQPYQEYCKQHHLMVSILVDDINDRLFDWIGDAVIEFDDQDHPQIVEDYEPDLQELLKED